MNVSDMETPMRPDIARIAQFTLGPPQEPTAGQVARRHSGRESVTQERAEFVGVGAVECGVESIAFVQRWGQYTDAARQRRACTLPPLVRTIAPRGNPVGGEVPTDIVITAAAHDDSHGGVDAVNPVDTALSEISFAAFEDCVRADVPNCVPGYANPYG